MSELGAGYDEWKAREPDFDGEALGRYQRATGTREPARAEQDRLGAQLFRARLALARAVGWAQGAGEGDEAWVADARKCLEEPAP